MLELLILPRMFVIGRKRGGTDEQPEETFTMVGTIGNVYEVTVGKLSNCTCPDSLNGNAALLQILDSMPRLPCRTW